VSCTQPDGATATGARVGRPRVHLRSTDSTNERARQLALAGAPHGTLVTAAEQTAGRGRQGRRWSAPAGSSLLASLLLRWQASAQPPTLLPLIAAVAVCDVAGGGAQIKWPNDIVLDTGAGLAKLAGILIEGRPRERWMVLGIGLNVAVRLRELAPELQPPPRALPAGASASEPQSRAHERAGADTHVGLPAATLGLSVADVEPLLAQLLEVLQLRLQEPPEATLRAWRARDALRGRAIAWGTPGIEDQLGRGRAEGIDGEGRLVVALADGSRTAIGAGEVHLREIA
jgi:BirA family transcriptional regulator, biotin operon repressor / biotin---[acetyl-CoA-carboxylase] ligase